MQGDDGRDAGLGKARALVVAFTVKLLSDEVENPGFLSLSELSSADICINKSLADFCNGLVAPSSDSLLREGELGLEGNNNGILLPLSPRSILLFSLPDDTFPVALLGHLCWSTKRECELSTGFEFSD